MNTVHNALNEIILHFHEQSLAISFKIFTDERNGEDALISQVFVKIKIIYIEHIHDNVKILQTSLYTPFKVSLKK